MKVAIIGAGFTGLSAACELVANGHSVDLYEKDSVVGGMASGFCRDNWEWCLEKHYHHIFESDKDIINFVEELGLDDLLFFVNAKTSVFYNLKFMRLDSVLSLLRFTPLNIVSRLRTGMVLLFLKISSNWKMLEKVTAYEFLNKTMGEESFNKIWKPLFKGKFGVYYKKINMAWFWARIKSRTKKLGYFKGGFIKLAEKIVERLEKKGVKLVMQAKVDDIDCSDGKKVKIRIKLKDKELSKNYDKVIVTSDYKRLRSIAKKYKKVSKHEKLKGVGAMTLILEMKKSMFDDIYWLNINDHKFPFLAVVEHTNFIRKKYYGNNTLIYIGKYLGVDDDIFRLDAEKLLDFYDKYLKKINKNYKKNIINKWLYKEKFAQPLVFIDHSKNMPNFKLADNLYWASMQHIYPYDRGTNFAVKLGREIANFIDHD